MKLTDKGFGLIGILLVIVVVAIIGVSGWAVYHHEHKSDAAKPVTKTSKTVATPKTKASTSASKSTPTPVLGTDNRASGSGVPGVGFGVVEPSEINNGGDPTGVATNITWQSWGGSQATGTGMSTYVAPTQTISDGSQEQATIVAFNLGTCDGVPSYNAVTWYFPSEEQTFNSAAYWNTCTGQDVQ